MSSNPPEPRPEQTAPFSTAEKAQPATKEEVRKVMEQENKSPDDFE